MKLYLALFLLVATIGINAQNLRPLLANPPISWESPSGLPPTDLRNMIKGTAYALIPLAGHPSVALELKNGNIPYTLYAGFRSIETQDPVNNNTIYRMASETKMVTAVSVLQHVEKGLIRLDDPVSKYIPSFVNATVIEKITPVVHSLTTIETVMGSPVIIISLQNLTIPEVATLHKKQVGIQMSSSIAGINVNGILTITGFSPSALTVSIELDSVASVSGIFTVSGTLDVLPRLPKHWTPYDYAVIPTATGLRERVYYSTSPSEPVTVRHLLTHTAGIGYGAPGASADLTSLQTAIMRKRDPDLVRWTLTPTLDVDVVQWASRIAAIPMKYNPGAQWSYGPQLSVAGAVLVAYERKATGNPSVGLYQIQKRDLFDPLGITDAGYFIKDDDPRRADKIARLVHEYTIADTGLNNGTITVTTAIGSMYFKGADLVLPGLQAALLDGANPTSEGDGNPLHPIYGSGVPRKHEAGDAGLYMRHFEFQRIVAMLSQNGTYNGQQILRPETVAQMFRNQIGDLTVVHEGVPGGNAKWGYGVVVGDQSTNPDALVQTTGHWSGAFGSWFFVNQRSNTAFSLSSNTLPGAYRSLVSNVASFTAMP